MRTMNNSDPLLRLLIDFFRLPPDTRPQDISQQTVESWDSLAMVQLIADLQGAFEVDFQLNEIQTLRSYDEIRACLTKKGAWPGDPRQA
jgi:acyl carrier protein